MDKAVNFYELKTQLADLGFHDPVLVDGLRQLVSSGNELCDIYTELRVGADKAYFALAFSKDPTGQYQLYCIEGCMDKLNIPNNQVMQNFKPDVPAAEAIELLQLDRATRPIATPLCP